jgi:hypothetical protein
MRAAEILRKLADIVDAHEEPVAAQQPVVVNVHAPEQSAPVPVVPQSDAPVPADDMMIPPLQQKLELMKKMAGEESAYDPDAELAIIKQNAGIAPLIADEDEPFEG